MKIVSVVGARPQFVKLAPIARALKAAGHQHTIVHTGQHYDAAMSDVFFDGLQIPPPDINLEVGSGSHGRQTGAILAAMDSVLEARDHPTWVLVYGDTNSTLAAALSAVKLHIPVAHLEAGLRSYNRRMPEEHNRVLTDHCADLLLAPTDDAVAHLVSEGLGGRSVLVGDVMADILYSVRDSLRAPMARGAEPRRYVVATVHRADNTDNSDRLRLLVEGLALISMPVRLLAHPRLRARAAEFGIDLSSNGSIEVLDPLPYRDMVSIVMDAKAVVTDSGGLQKEAFLLGTPCTTVRSETEWPETLEGGWNVMCEDPQKLRHTVDRDAPRGERGQPFGDGHAASRVVEALQSGSR